MLTVTERVALVLVWTASAVVIPFSMPCSLSNRPVFTAFSSCFRVDGACQIGNPVGQ
jgi:hypothetical protein